MKTLINLLILLAIAFSSLVPTYSQKKKKVEPWELEVVYYNWWYCWENGYYKENCIEKMQLIIENNSNSVVRKVTFWVEIRNTDDQIIYKRKHSAILNPNYALEISKGKKNYRYFQRKQC
ncbi:hypothetical protein D9V87_10615 [Bacteroidetes/Chlorobi group bacterium MS-B_bin-24]|jgi:hypothetical protein|nr:MAG: hypothetical protein D9V87_10615 [Bacteroidetes/Chlorobi group bacterium MS-B_bin-24]